MNEKNDVQIVYENVHVGFFPSYLKETKKIKCQFL